MLNSSLWIAACASLVSAHMQLTFPIPLASTLDPMVANPDYSMTTPLSTDGSNFPCKGYLGRSDAHVTAAFSAGQQANFTLAGSAVHGGGSCQISLSYDGGKTFKVINTILGGCPLQNAYNFQFPSELPGGKSVIFSWSWFNKVGNREMYQNCALVDIAGTGSTSFLSTLPDMQVANVGNGCTSVESIEVIPVNPGANVQYGGSYAAGSSAVSGKNGAGLTGTCGSAAVVVPPASTSTSTSAKKTTTSATGGRAGFPVAPTTAVTTTKTTSTPPAAPTSPSTGCVNGAIICTGTGYTWSLCSAGTPVAMGAVAPGTICKNGQMVAGSGNAAALAAGKATTSTSTRPLTTSTTSKATATPTTACLNKRDLGESCELFAMRCASPYSYSFCEGGDWSMSQSLASDELCVNDQVIHVAHLQSETQAALQRQPVCSGTGISCSEDGTSYYVCNDETPTPVPRGTRCLESNLGGGFVAWHSIRG